MHIGLPIHQATPIAGQPGGLQIKNATRSRATCPYCGVGCVVDVEARNETLLRVDPPMDAAPNFGMLCPKGALLFKSDAPARRLTRPMIRRSKDEPLQPVSWQTAMGFIADKTRDALGQRGPDSVAFYGSGQLDTEASYLFTKLFKGYLRTNQMDTNSRLCMSSAVAGYVTSLGSDGPPTCYDDIEQADTIFILGANMAANHPVLLNRVRRRRATDDGVRIIVVDPRETKTTALADLHLPVRPGGDVALLNLILRCLIDEGRFDRAFIEKHTEGFDAFLEMLQGLDLEQMHRACGIGPEELDRLIEMITLDRRLLSFYCMGANQSSRGTDKNTALINLHLVLGQIGMPGAGPFSLTGQPNAMGGREVGYLSHQLPGYRLVKRDADRDAVERYWGLEPGAIQSEPGRPAVEMFQAAADGEIDVLWVACTNPAVSMPNVAVTQTGLRNTPLVIVQDCFGDTETAQYADVLLPAAAWGEKTGTMTNSERLVTRSKPAKQPPGEALADWQIVARFGQAIGFAGFDFDAAEQVWDEFRELTAGTLCDLSGMTNGRLEQSALHWPCPNPAHPGTPRRYLDRRFPTESGRARIIASAYQPPAESTSDQFPLCVTTGRVASQWHTRARTANVPELVRQSPRPFVQVHPDDASDAGLEPGGWAYVCGRRGRALASVVITREVPAGTVFLPFHWGDNYHPQTQANYLTQDACDPVSKQPELKFSACRLEPAEAPLVRDLYDFSKAERAPSTPYPTPRNDETKSASDGRRRQRDAGASVGSGVD